MKWLVIILALAVAFPAFGQQDFRGKDLEGKDLTGRDLRGADLRDSNFSEANLTGADLTGAKVEGADFRGADLSKAILRGLNFSKAQFRHTILRGTDLRETLGLLDITDLDFTDADLRGADLSLAVDYQPGSARFRGARYDTGTRWPKGIEPGAVGARVFGKTVEPGHNPPPEIPRPKIPPSPKDSLAAKEHPAPKAPPPAKRAVGQGRDLRKKDLSSRDLRPEDLEGANLEGATLWSVDLRNMNLQYASFKGADLTMANLEGANLTGADMRDATFRKVNLRGAVLNEADLQKVDLTQAGNLRDTSFRGADLRGLKGLPPYELGGNDWRGADLRGAFLAGSGLGAFKDARLRRAKYDRTTVWPHGMALEDTGAEFIETDTSDADVPPKLFAPDHDWSAPSEETVKKRFVQYQLSVKYGVNRSKQGDKPIEEPKGNRTTFHFTGMVYGRAGKGVVIPENLGDREREKLDANSLPVRTIYSVQVQCEMISFQASAADRKEEFDLEMGFWKKDNGTWETAAKEGFILLK